MDEVTHCLVGPALRFPDGLKGGALAGADCDGVWLCHGVNLFRSGYDVNPFREDIFRPFGHPPARDGMGLRSRRVPFSRASMRLNLATNN